MKKILFLILTFFMFLSFTNAHLKSAQFVGGTGGSKILEMNVKDDSLNSTGVIYDRDASLVYEITYTNVGDLDKKVTDVILPKNDILLSYDTGDLKKERVIKPGETVSFKYSIKALETVTIEELEKLNENAKAQLVLSSIEVENSETTDLIFRLFIVLFISFSLYKFTRDKKVLYGVFFVGISILSFNPIVKVVANNDEIININTGVKYILSNLAPSCANLDYEGDFCIDWKRYGNRDKINYLVMTDSKVMADNYSIGNVGFTLQNTYDVSEQQNGDVVLGVYKANTTEESYLFLIGQDGGVIVSKDASYQFTSYDSVNNKSENDFKYVKYADFSKFYSNKTIDMSYMLTGIGTLSSLEKLDLSGFETSNVTNMSYMFTGVGEYTKNLNIDVSHFDTSNVTNMEGMFWETGYESGTINLDLSNFDTSNVKNMSKMFFNFGVYSNEVNLDIYSFDTSNVENMESMFYGFNCLNPNYYEIKYFFDWDTSNVKNMKYMFGMNMSHGFERNERWNDEGFVNIDLTGLDFDNVVDMSYMFSNNVGIDLNVDGDIDTSNVVNMRYIFNLTTIMNNFDITKFDTSNAVDVSGLFEGLYYATELDVSSFDFGKVEKMEELFSNFNGKLLNLDKLDVSNVKDMEWLFNYYGYFDGKDISNWDLSSVENFGGMFRCIKDIEVLDLSNLNFVNGTDYSYMFMNFSGSNLVLKEIDVSDSDWNEDAIVEGMFHNLKDVTIYVKDEKAKSFIQKQAPECTVLIKE